MPNPVLSFKLLACCWGGVALLAGSGAVALQLSQPDAAPVVVAAPAPVLAASPRVTATPLPATTPMPFRNSSLLALLTPALERPAERERTPEHFARPIAVAPALPLPLPPIPPPAPVHHLARVEPRRPAPVYVAAPQPAYPNWGRPMPYPGQFASVRQYQYGAPPAYYGWQPYY